MTILPINWSVIKEPTTTIKHHHVIGSTPIGNYLITWNGWKEFTSYVIEKSPISADLFSSQMTLELAKEVCKERFEQAISDCIQDIDR